jgi:hypothetical protein
LPSGSALSYKSAISVRRAPIRDLGGADLPQIVDLGGLARDSTSGHLGNPAEDVLRNERVRSGGGLDPNDTDAGIILRAVVLAIAEITQPCLERRAIMLLDERTVRDDARLPGDGSPLSRSVGEGDVDVGIARQVIGLARLGVRVEEKVDAAGLLEGC